LKEETVNLFDWLNSFTRPLDASALAQAAQKLEGVKAKDAALEFLASQDTNPDESFKLMPAPAP
jgi:hypothetical protein